MRTNGHACLIVLGAALALAGCQKAPDSAAKPAAAATATATTTATDTATADDAAATATTQATWPASLNAFGDGFPNPGDPCRRIGESAATVDFLDHTATLAGCLSADDAARLGGTVVATVDGVTLVSIPGAAGMPGDGGGE